MSESIPTQSSEPNSNLGESQRTLSATLKPRLINRVVRTMIRGIPTVLVLALLAAIALWGHQNGWKLPKFSELTGKSTNEQELWCDEHGVPEAECIACNADLMPKEELFGWCKEHGVHECVLHHPQVSQLEKPPAIGKADFERAQRAITARPRTPNDPLCRMHLRRIQFPSIEAVNRAGIDITLVERGPVIESIKTTGEVVYDQTRVAQLASRANGTIWKVEKELGDQVRKGEVLALVDAAEVGNKKADLLQAVVQYELDIKTYDRIARLGGSVIPQKRVEQASKAKKESEFKVESAIQALLNLGLFIERDKVFGTTSSELRQQLNTLGLPKSVVTSNEQSKLTSNLIPVIAPRDGIVVKRNAVAGEVIETDRPLFTIADTSRMWLLLNVPLEEAQRISIGQELIFHPDGSTHESLGKIKWISTEVDNKTRIVKVRGELSNDNSTLRNETFGAGEIILRKETDAIVVPKDAIHWEGCCHVAFVRDKNYFKDGSFKVFHTRSVRPGAIIGDKVEVIAGLLPGEVIVTKGSGILRAELLKGNLGAG